MTGRLWLASRTGDPLLEPGRRWRHKSPWTQPGRSPPKGEEERRESAGDQASLPYQSVAALGIGEGSLGSSVRFGTGSSQDMLARRGGLDTLSTCFDRQNDAAQEIPRSRRPDSRPCSTTGGTMDFRRKLLVGALVAGPLVGGGAAAWAAISPAAGALTAATTQTASTVYRGAIADVQTGVTANVQTGVTVQTGATTSASDQSEAGPAASEPGA